MRPELHDSALPQSTNDPLPGGRQGGFRCYYFAL